MLDVHADADHHRSVVTLVAATVEDILGELLEKLALAVTRIHLPSHSGVHPRVGAADVVPLVPLGGASLAEAVGAARRLGERVWQDLAVPVYFYAHAAGGRRLAEIRRGGLAPDLGGPGQHATAGAVCIGARPPLVAYNLTFSGVERGFLRSVVPQMRQLPGVQALSFPLAGGRAQLSMNLTRLEAAGVADVHAAALRLTGAPAEPELVGLCPASAAGPGCDGGLLEARLAAAAARRAASLARHRGGQEQERLADRLEAESSSLAGLEVAQEAVLGGAERAAALVRVIEAARLDDLEAEAMLTVAAAGLRAAVTEPTARRFAARLALLDEWLADNGG